MEYKFCLGDPVKLCGQVCVGEIVQINGKRAIVAFQGLEIGIPLSRLEKVSKDVVYQYRNPSETRILNLEADAFASFNPEIDLHGMSVHEALQALDQCTDRAVLLGHKQLKVIHGKGEGILRNAVRTHCESHRQVRHVNALHPYSGGAGVTWLEII